MHIIKIEFYDTHGKEFKHCHGLPFEVKLDEPNETTYAALADAEKDDEMYGPFDSVAELMEALNA